MNKHKYRLYLLYSFFVLLFSSCGILPHPDIFVMDKRSNSPIECMILSSIDSVVQKTDHEMYIYNGGIVSIKREELTQFHFVCRIDPKTTSGIRFYLRTDPWKYQHAQGIVCDFNESGAFIFENGNHVQTIDSVKLSTTSPLLVQIKQDGSKYLILADCDTVYHGTTKIPATEYIIIKSIGSDAAIYDLHLDHVFDSDKYNRQSKVDKEKLLEKLKNN